MATGEGAPTDPYVALGEHAPLLDLSAQVGGDGSMVLEALYRELTAGVGYDFGSANKLGASPFPTDEEMAEFNP